jgi:hypothetical protein
MTSMPIITDQMVEDFRRTGKRRASYSTSRSSRLLSRGSRVVPQQQNPCIGKHGVQCGDSCPFPDMWCCDGYPKFGPC